MLCVLTGKALVVRLYLAFARLSSLLASFHLCLQRLTLLWLRWCSYSDTWHAGFAWLEAKIHREKHEVLKLRTWLDLESVAVAPSVVNASLVEGFFYFFLRGEYRHSCEGAKSDHDTLYAELACIARLAELCCIDVLLEPACLGMDHLAP